MLSNGKKKEKEKEHIIFNILPAPSCDTSSAPEDVNPCPHTKLETFLGSECRFALRFAWSAGGRGPHKQQFDRLGSPGSPWLPPAPPAPAQKPRNSSSRRLCGAAAQAAGAGARGAFGLQAELW